MADRKKMTLDDFDLLVRSLHREWVRDKRNFSVVSSTLFYNCNNSVSIFDTSHGPYWSTFGKYEYTSSPPWFFFMKDCEKWNYAVSLLREMRGEKAVDTSTAEEHICKYVTCAADILAERALTSDDNRSKS
jgi:hypothetical protein